MSATREARFRANPGYELVLLDRLEDAERGRLEEAAQDYGVLRPRPGAELELRSACSDTALLFLTLGEPAPLPSYVLARLGSDTDRVITRLVLDGVLEIEHRGEFLSGARAAGVVLPGRSAGGSGRVGELSLAALAYGRELSLVGMSEDEVALRLYAYGRCPLTADLCRRLGSAAALDAHLGLDAGGPAARALGSAWRESRPVPGEQVHWRSWRARGAGRAEGVGYKLYVSPDIDAVGGAFAAVARVLGGARGVTAFKLGAGVEGLCRPDKLVVYFDRLDDLQEGSSRLGDELDGCPAHGVPFTASVTSDGLLSWGADPPAGEEGGTSWRLWVARRLAEYLGLGVSADVDAAQFALERLRLEGVDTDTWIPSREMWALALASA